MHPNSVAAFAAAFSAYAPGMAAIVAVLTLAKAVYEYVRQNKFHRFQKFQEMSARFDDNEAIQSVCKLLLADAPELRTLGKQTKEVFICFIEEIAMLQNS